MSNPNLVPGLSASQVRDLLDDGAVSREEARAYLQARVDACVARGAKPKFPTVALLEELAGAPIALPTGLTTRKQRIDAFHAARAAAKAPKAPKAAKARTNRSGISAQNPMVRAIAGMVGESDEALAAFVTAVMEARK